MGNQIYNPDTEKLEFPRHRSASRQPVEPRVPSRPGNRTRDGGRGPAWQHVLDFRTPNRFETLTSDPEGVDQQRRKPVCERSPLTPLDETVSKRCRDDPSNDDLPPPEEKRRASAYRGRPDNPAAHERIVHLALGQTGRAVNR